MGFFDKLQTSLESPLFLGGIGMISGGFEGLGDGLFAGNQLQSARRKREQEDASRQSIEGAFSSMPNLSEGEKGFFRANPDHFNTMLSNMLFERENPSFGLKQEALRADIDHTRARTRQALTPEGVPAKDRAGMEEGLRKEFAGLAKPYFDTRDAFSRIESSAKDPSPAGDIATIFGFMRMLDPTSTVREGEFATAQNAAGVPDQVRNLANRLLNGERLGQGQREDFMNRARQLYGGQEQQYQNIQNQYRGISERMGVDPRNTIVDFSRPADADGWHDVGDGVRIREKR